MSVLIGSSRAKIIELVLILAAVWGFAVIWGGGGWELGYGPHNKPKDSYTLQAIWTPNVAKGFKFVIGYKIGYGKEIVIKRGSSPWYITFNAPKNSQISLRVSEWYTNAYEFGCKIERNGFTISTDTRNTQGTVRCDIA